MRAISGTELERRLPHFLPHLAEFLICVSIPLLFAEENTPPDSYVGSQACSTCHAGIYKSYSETPMGQASGKVGEAAADAPLGEFFHAPSGVRYRIFREQGDSYFEFRKNTSPDFGREIQGRRRLDFFIGSGAHARGYLFQADGFLFQAPISYYSARAIWDVAPGYESNRNIFLGRMIEEECLECHASGLRRIKGTRNRYGAVPFWEGAISCERCHGPGRAHIARMTGGASSASISIVNPMKLEARRRDSVCAQCHLAGEARIAKVGRSSSTYRPGDILSDHVASFVSSSVISREMKVIGHFEGLWNSQCKRASGDRLWCGVCHDPHSVPRPGQRAEFFRRKCLSCHQESSCQSSRAARAKSGDDCVDCHMPKQHAVDGLHTAFTNHSIRRPGGGRPRSNAGGAQWTLVPFWDRSADIRDLALAYGQIAASSQKSEDYARAFQALKSAAKRAAPDAEVLTELGYIYERSGDLNKAVPLYQQALAADPGNVAASVNLAKHLAERERLPEAIRLWENALSSSPGLAAPAINLSQVYLQNGNRRAAQELLIKVLEFNPDSPYAWKLWSTLSQKRNQ
jgi:hypothetical protein